MTINVTFKVKNMGLISAIVYVIGKIKFVFLPLIFLIGTDATIGLVVKVIKHLMRIEVVTIDNS